MLNKLENLNNFYGKVFEEAYKTIKNADFHDSQSELLFNTVSNFFSSINFNLMNNAISIFYLIAKAWKQDLDQEAENIAVFSLFYFLSLDLFDDVEDDDLEGKPHENYAPSIAINNALTLFTFSINYLVKADKLSGHQDYLTFVHRFFLKISGGQHIDLSGNKINLSSEEVLTKLQEKTASIAMFIELGARYARCKPEIIEIYKKIGRPVLRLGQIVSDIGDIFGNKKSPDLLTRKRTYPIACFYEIATEEQLERFNSLLEDLPGSIKEIRQLLYYSGIMEKCTQTLEELRKEIHNGIASTGNKSAYHRMFLYKVDYLPNLIYPVKILDSTKEIYQPDTKLQTEINNWAKAFISKTNLLAEIPFFIPWHEKFWQSRPDNKIIYYPDMAELPEEILPFYSELFLCEEENYLKAVFMELVPYFTLRELYKYSRKSKKHTLSEEYCINGLFAAFLKEFYPELINDISKLIFELITKHPDKLTEDKIFLIKNLSNGKEPDEEIIFGDINSLEKLLISFKTFELIRENELINEKVRENQK